MKKLLNRVHYAIYILLCVCFFSCSNITESKNYKKSECNIDSILVKTIEGDTVIIYSGYGGHISIVPKDYLNEK